MAMLDVNFLVTSEFTSFEIQESISRLYSCFTKCRVQREYFRHWSIWHGPVCGRQMFKLHCKRHHEIKHGHWCVKCIRSKCISRQKYLSETRLKQKNIRFSKYHNLTTKELVMVGVYTMLPNDFLSTCFTRSKDNSLMMGFVVLTEGKMLIVAFWVVISCGLWCWNPEEKGLCASKMLVSTYSPHNVTTQEITAPLSLPYNHTKLYIMTYSIKI